jgi:hypothetical protein
MSNFDEMYHPIQLLGKGSFATVIKNHHYSRFIRRSASLMISCLLLRFITENHWTLTNIKINSWYNYPLKCRLWSRMRLVYSDRLVTLALRLCTRSINRVTRWCWSLNMFKVLTCTNYWREKRWLRKERPAFWSNSWLWLWRNSMGTFVKLKLVVDLFIETSNSRMCSYNLSRRTRQSLLTLDLLSLSTSICLLARQVPLATFLPNSMLTFHTHPKGTSSRWECYSFL